MFLKPLSKSREVEKSDCEFLNMGLRLNVLLKSGKGTYPGVGTGQFSSKRGKATLFSTGESK